MNTPDLYIQTPYESSGFTKTATYLETIRYYTTLQKLTPLVSLDYFGKSENGVRLPLITLGKSENSSAHSGKLTLLIQNCIHPGEPEGNDATMMLARELVTDPKNANIFDKLVILIVPIFSVDGHNRSGPHNRINQNGPQYQGWRTNAKNLNLNRDYLKADSAEMKAMLRLLNKWKPDFFIDNHTTNGLDYQYHITYSLEKYPLISELLESFALSNYLPYIQGELEKSGFLHTYYIELMSKELEEGLLRIPGMPRFSTGYLALRNRIGLLVETHSLKPFKNRVESTFCINKATIKFLVNNKGQVLELNKTSEVEESRLYCKGFNSFAVEWEASEEFIEEEFAALAYISTESAISGSEIKKYSNEPITVKVPVYNKIKVKNEIAMPEGYLVPKGFGDIHEVLTLHGFAPSKLKVRGSNIFQLSISDVVFAERPYEGRFRIKDFHFSPQPVRKLKLQDYRYYPANQMNSRLLGYLLDPRSPDSFFQWGFFNAFFERKEYAEDFVFEPIAEQMMVKNRKLREEFIEKLNDEDFRNSPQDRLDFLYKKSDYFDKREGIYPIFYVD